MALTCHLVVFARLPRVGAGKRRLARDVGTVEALRFQRTMLHITLRRLAGDPRWITWLALTPMPQRPMSGRFYTIPQGRGSLGDRMAAVAQRLPPGPVVIIGSDIPGISTAAIAKAFRLLGSNDAVFGPAMDGGYWWTKKHGKSFYGYKNHVNADAKYKLIRHYEVTDASVHDSRKLNELLSKKNTSADVYADSAYRSGGLSGQQTARSYGSDQQGRC